MPSSVELPTGRVTWYVVVTVSLPLFVSRSHAAAAPRPEACAAFTVRHSVSASCSVFPPAVRFTLTRYGYAPSCGIPLISDSVGGGIWDSGASGQGFGGLVEGGASTGFAGTRDG